MEIIEAFVIFVASILDPMLFAYWIVKSAAFGFFLAIGLAAFWLFCEIFLKDKVKLTIQNVSVYYLFVVLTFSAIQFAVIFYI